VRELLESGPRDPVRTRKVPWRALLFVAYALAVLAIGWAYALWTVQVDRRSTLASSSEQLQVMATALGSQMEAMLNDGVGAASAAANVIRTTGGSRMTPEAQRAVLDLMATGGSYVHALFIVQGNHLTLSMAPGREPPEETEQLRWLEAISRSTATTWIGPPGMQADSRAVEAAFARRVDDIDGVPAWAGAVIGWEQLDENYTRLSFNHSSFAMVSEEGTILLRLPLDEFRDFIGEDADRYESTRLYRQLPIAPLVAFVGPDPLDARPRQYAIRRIENAPMVAVVGRSVDDALVAWRARRDSAVRVFVTGSLALLALTFALYRLLTHRYRALVRSEERFALAIAGTSDGIWEWDGESGRVFLAPRLLQLLGRAADDRTLARPEAATSLVHPDDLHRAEGALRLHLNRQRPLDIELRLRVGEGYRWFRARGQAIWDERGTPLRMAGAIGDIHEGRLASQAVEQARLAQLEARQEFARELIQAQEHERRRLANELHDGVGQNLSLIRNRTLMLQRMELPPSAQHQAQALYALASDAIEEVRSVAHNLRPLHIEEMGVTDAIEALVERLRHSSGLEVAADVENIDDALHGSAATHVFRIVQEAVNNVLKHADAKCVSLTVKRDLTQVQLVIRDDGIGFEPPRAGGLRRSGGLGLLSMQERSGILGATLSIDSAPGRGTTLAMTIPVEDHGANDEPDEADVPTDAGEGSDDR